MNIEFVGVVLGVGVAGGVGAAARYLVDTSLPQALRDRFPWGILGINVSGSFALGLMLGLALDVPLLAVLSSGVLGGYTTFSTASVDTVRLLRQRRYGAALANGPGMLALTVGAAAAGLMLASA